MQFIRGCGGFLLASGLILMVCPFFGYTLSGFEDYEYLQSFPVAVGMLILGIILVIVTHDSTVQPSAVTSFQISTSTQTLPTKLLTSKVNRYDLTQEKVMLFIDHLNKAGLFSQDFSPLLNQLALHSRRKIIPNSAFKLLSETAKDVFVLHYDLYNGIYDVMKEENIANYIKYFAALSLLTYIGTINNTELIDPIIKHFDNYKMSELNKYGAPYEFKNSNNYVENFSRGILKEIVYQRGMQLSDELYESVKNYLTNTGALGVWMAEGFKEELNNKE